MAGLKGLPLDADTIQNELRKFLVDELGIEERELDPASRLITTGIIDSMDVLMLVAFVENNFGLTIKALDVSVEEFDSLDRLAEFVLHRATASLG